MAVAYYVASLRFQLLVSRRSGRLVPAITAAGLLARLSCFAVILVLLALFTNLNVLALAVAFVALYTILSALGMRRYITKAKRDRASGGSENRGGVFGG